MRWIAWIVSAIAYIVASGAIAEAPWGANALGRYGIAALLMFCIVLIHEGGHAVVAWRCGADIRSIMVFPFRFDLATRRFGMARRHGKGDVGGYVAYRLDRIDAARKHLVIAAAGPVANLLSAALVMQVLALPGGGTGTFGALATAFAILSIGVAIANLLPFGGSDGMTILRLASRRRP